MRTALGWRWLFAVLAAAPGRAQNPPDSERFAPAATTLVAREDESYRRIALPIPDGVLLEVGGLLRQADGALLVATRRGEIWRVEGVDEETPRPRFTRLAGGLHEILGIAAAPGGDGVLVVQRGEVTRLRDTDGDGRFDRFETVYEIPASGNFHEFAYGPVLAPDGSLRITLNLAFAQPDASPVRWRGWMLELSPTGEVTPIAAGMRSPSGFLRTARGDWFYTENQGEWIAAGWVSHVERGDFMGHPASLAWSREPGSTVKLTPADVPSLDIPFPEAVKKIPGLKPPAVWLPQAIMGIATTGIIEDTSEGKFGPFAGQFFVGDQGQSKVMRISLERVEGAYQGACYSWHGGFDSGVVRLAWGGPGTLFVGSTSRGWASVGPAPFALERVRWTGRAPLEIREITAAPGGFRIEFTEPIDPASATDPAAYAIAGFTYNYHRAYGSAVVNRMSCPVVKVVRETERRVRLAVACLRDGYIHEINTARVRSPGGATPLHPVAYYTLNRQPRGATLVPATALAELCSPTPAAAGAPVVAENRFTIRPLAWPTVGADETMLRVRALPGLKFDTMRLKVARGARVRLTLENGDDMLHNWVLCQPGRGPAVGTAALALGLDAATRHYVPDSSDVLAYTSALQPQATETIFFTAPAIAGDYDFICSLPGHAITMKGTLVVE